MTIEKLPYLSAEFLDGLAISTSDVVDEIERQIIGQRRGEVWCAPKAVVLPGDDRYIMATLGVATEPRVLATKSLVVNPRNSERGLATLNSLITLLDAETGLPLAVVDGNWVTAKRTAGLSAVAARRLARADPACVAFIGCGVQARGHLEVLADLFPLQEIRAFARSKGSREALCRIAETRGLRAVPSDTAKAAVEPADIVVTTVTLIPEPVPFLDARWLKAGVFATMTDLALPWLPETMAIFDRIVIDDLVQEAQMSKPMVRPELVAGDLTGLVSGDVPGRQSASERTAFAFRGMAVGDLAIAGLAFVRAKAIGALDD
ncbi:MAG: ornithine cyclodeaminase family protein [Mesorhizobium sp.]|uniref:ornithine cyclodeaminase family protein n=1 Tax=unclassified Mesorhizobium TaxID=325217 RepID=UPI000FD5024F|nr:MULTISPECIES: ornithine cyclodeaminase family protein [unclassified Mesorhizobium]RVD39176.1 ornithine cyclodeaminase family protein [Mesorhizobium sp. M4A.F.Ca.ET.020.02.1.1]RWC16267.1 MAG: ornithine cyclodeaminase family protein [Mesorhizobium sp.]RWD01284.1 MAG: ornithine cyclodeaminase family protein [Mesorhizobium sp.]RWD20811.1 MAG: ornithine cyclodeaminase family protein [Mesorhizobium sp.]RWD36546.1 MAG: ornithine cyclodeaminase family protein [Mesorhizobium sp.]